MVNTELAQTVNHNPTVMGQGLREIISEMCMQRRYIEPSGKTAVDVINASLCAHFVIVALEFAACEQTGFRLNLFNSRTCHSNRSKLLAFVRAHCGAEYLLGCVCEFAFGGFSASVHVTMKCHHLSSNDAFSEGQAHLKVPINEMSPHGLRT